MKDHDRYRVLFLCTGNSCRSQMAEGWARAMWGDRIEAYSAGIERHGLNPNAVKVMAEAGIDISGHRSKLVDDLVDVGFDLVVTVCDHAHETCPMFPGGAEVIHVGFDDPPKLAEAAGTEEAKLDCYRRVRDEIKAFVETLPDVMKAETGKDIPASRPEATAIRDGVRERYAGIATADGGCCCSSTSCCAPDALGQPDASAKLGYSDNDLSAVPEGANMGLGCGNPQVITALKTGETVLDLGSGGGFDCFLAAGQVGDSGHVIGVDMTPEMISKARANADKGGYGNVEFRLGEIEHLPVADGSVDVILSNCVINPSPDKPQVYRDAFRVLRPGGRLAIADVVALGQLPDGVSVSLDAYCGCVAGAIPARKVEALLQEIGFVEIAVEVKQESREFIKDWFPGSGLEEHVRSAEIRARKPAGCGCCG
ncbi:MAG: arsenite methyltransferase [Candidatus Pacebacteria bacterium]|nr:arsenite methyltransferase [Candidatus Paceibacterota bacterium]